MQWGSFAALAVGLAASAASAQRVPARVIVIGEPPGEGGIFVDTMRVQLGDIAEVVVAPALPSGTVAERVRAAIATCESDSATVALWIEDGGSAWVAYVVTARHSGAAVEIVEASAQSSWDAARELALKVRWVVERVLAQPETRLEAVLEGLAPARAAPRIDAPPESAAGRPRARLLMEARLAVGAWLGPARSQTEGRVGAGVSTSTGALRLEALAALGVEGTSGWSAPVGSVQIVEWGGGVQVRALSGATVAVGVEVGVGVRVLHASGEAADGRRGDAVRAVGVVDAAVLLRIALGGPAHIQLGAGVESAFVRQRFAIDEMNVADGGAVRLQGLASVVLVVD